jgi:hypothetical protein
MSVDKQQAFQEPELRDRVVRRVDRLQTFLSGNADANVRRLDHANVVCTVTNRERHGIEAVPDEFDNQCLLFRRHTTTHDTLTQHSETKKQVFVRLIFESL